MGYNFIIAEMFIGILILTVILHYCGFTDWVYDFVEMMRRK